MMPELPGGGRKTDKGSHDLPHFDLRTGVLAPMNLNRWIYSGEAKMIMARKLTQVFEFTFYPGVKAMLAPEIDALKQEIKRLIIESLELEDTCPDDIADDASLFGDDGIGLDSIDALELGIALRKKYQLPLADNDAGNRENFSSVSNLARFVQATRHAE